MPRLSSVVLALALGLAASEARAHDTLRSLAAEIAKSAERSGTRSLAVLGFVAEDIDGPETAIVLEERLLSHLVGLCKSQVVERRLLTRLLRERYLSQVGAVAPVADPWAILPVDAVVAGTVSFLGTEVELAARLVEVRTGRILFAAARRMRLPGRAVRREAAPWRFSSEGGSAAQRAEARRLEWMVQQARMGVWRFPPRGDSK